MMFGVGAGDCGNGYTCNEGGRCALPVPAGGNCTGTGKQRATLAICVLMQWC